jgi:hypothetical protein
MNATKVFLSLFFLLVLSGTALFAQNAGGFTNFSSLDGGYTLQLPAGADLASAGPLKPEQTGMGEGYYNTWRFGAGFFEAGYIKFGGAKSQPFQDADNNLDKAVQDVLDAESAKGVTPVYDKELTGSGGQKARELLFEANSKMSIYRVYGGDGVIVRLRTVTKNEPAQLRAAFRFLNSLRLASRDEIFTLMIVDATPADLPQVKPTQWVKPDAEELAKGKVKTIVEEVENPKSDTAPGMRRRADYFFDPQGFLTKTVMYDYTGFPSMVSAYGFIDGMRVSKTGDVQNERIFSGQLPAMPGQITKKRDARYAVRVAEKYDASKRVTERTFYDNAGDLFLRAIYAYRGDRVEISEYRKTGTPDNSVSQTLDAKGNILQKITREFGKEPSERKTSYKYLLFDNKDNWTKRTVSNEVKKGGKVTSYEYTEYRTITYY